jgi:5-oxopent-3-ene-1,2,5-tricarboxylate decarboxylase / 2-hydroxyhepta-2,4-diene-1,7-dioate isomerase
MPAALATFDIAPHRFSGVVYGALLNHAPELAALGDAAHQAPYKAPPRAPVLQLKPRNTLARDGDAIEVPAGVPALVMGATLGIVIKRTACRVTAAQALDFVAGYTIVNDVHVPVASHYRPAVRLRARDGFCPISSEVRLLHKADDLVVEVFIDGQLAQRSTTGERVRSVAQLLADVTEFMTLQAGDLLLLGASANAPLARAGQRVEIHIDGLGSLRNHLVQAAA